MDLARNGNFITAFLQGLAVAFFLYVVIFTATIFKGAPVDNAVKTLASGSAVIARNETPSPPAPAIPAPEPAQPTPAPLQPGDQVAPPSASPTGGLPMPGFIPVPEGQQAATAPDIKDLIETTPQGPMPRRAPSGLTPFDAYKKQFKDPGMPVIALAVLDYGLSEENSKDALKKLPAEVSLILTPYTQSGDVWKNLAGAQGHEFWISVPMENQIYPNAEDPGPQALLAHSDFKYNQDKFIWALTRTTGYAGFTGYTDAAFLNAQSALKSLWDEAYNRGLAYFEINPAGLEGVEMNAVEKTAPYIRNQAILDESTQDVDKWLQSLELEANNNGYAIGVIRDPYPRTMDAVATWAANLRSRGYALAPVSALAQVKNDSVAGQKHAAP